MLEVMMLLASSALGSSPFGQIKSSLCDLDPHIASGDLYTARRIATALAQTAPRKEADECSKRWRRLVDRQLLHPELYLPKVTQAHQRHRQVARAADLADCFGGTGPGWNECCGGDVAPGGLCFVEPKQNPTACCTFGVGSSAYRAIPALQETGVNVRLLNGRQLSLEQDGRLRSFDMATVLWPGGYLLAQWMSSFAVCSKLQEASVLELGTGIGAASIVAAGCGARVVATDLEWRSLAITVANAALNDVAVQTVKLDWFSDRDVDAALLQGPYNFIVAASAQFERWAARLWDVLAMLTPCRDVKTCRHGLDSHKCVAPMAVLVHGTDSQVTHPPTGTSTFMIHSRVQSSSFGMLNPYSNSSDFEIVILQRIC